MEKIKLKNIEILRFLFILLIIACHINQGITRSFPDIEYYNNFIKCTHWSWMPVDFFFIMSGFFLFLKTNFQMTFIDFVKNKIIRLLPLVWVVLLITFVLSFFTPIKWLPHENLFTVLNLQNVGLTFRNGSIPPSWYVSSLFWGMCFYFYFYKTVNIRLFNLITACLIFFCYAILLHVPNHHNPLNYFYFINMGMIRSLAGIGIGYFINLIYKNYIINNTISSLKSKFILSVIELYAFWTVFYYLGFHYTEYKNFLFIILVFIILFITFLINKGILSNLLNNNLSVFLGKFTYSIFLIHYLIKNLWKIYVCTEHKNFVILHPQLNIILLYITTILAGVILYYLVERPLTKYLKNKFK